MMDLSVWVLIIFVIVVLVVIWVTKQVVRTLFFASAFVLVVLIGLGFMVLSDVKDIRSNFPTTPSMFLLVDQGVVLSGIVGSFGEDFNPVLLSDSQLSAVQSNFAEHDLVAVKGDNYKLIVINKSSFEGLSVYDSDLRISQDQILSLLSSDSPVDDYIFLQFPQSSSQAQFSALKDDFLEQAHISDDSEFKSVLFGILLSESMAKDPLFVFKGFLHGDALFFPETIAFKALRYLPESLLGYFVVVEGD